MVPLSYVRAVKAVSTTNDSNVRELHKGKVNNNSWEGGEEEASSSLFWPPPRLLLMWSSPQP